jgi:hypothetical protein
VVKHRLFLVRFCSSIFGFTAHSLSLFAAIHICRVIVAGMLLIVWGAGWVCLWNTLVPTRKTRNGLTKLLPRRRSVSDPPSRICWNDCGRPPWLPASLFRCLRLPFTYIRGR